MKHQNYLTKAESMYESAMDEIHNHVSDAKEVVEELSVFIDGLVDKPNEAELEYAEKLVSKAMIALCKIQ